MKKRTSIRCLTLVAASVAQTCRADLIIGGTDNATWPSPGDANAIMSYTVAPTDPTTVSPAGGYVRIGSSGTGSLDMISGTLTLDCTAYGAIVGQASGNGTLTVDGGALTWNATGYAEQYFFIGNSSSTGVVTVNRGTFALNANSLLIGRDPAGIGVLNINGGVTTCNAGTVGLGSGGSPDATTSGTINFGAGDGVLNFTATLPAITFGTSGGANHINFQSGSGGKLEIQGWTQSQFAALVAAGDIRTNGVTTTDPALFAYSSSNGTGIFGLAATASPPSFGRIQATANGLVMSGSGGTANAVYYLLSATNLALTQASWTRVLTNQFDGGGNFAFTNAPATNAAQSFYRLQLQ